jgi:hypothetical protein
MDKDGVTLKNVRGSKILGQEKHTSRGSKLMNFRLVSRSKILCVVSQKLYKWCHSNTCNGVHKKCKIQMSAIYSNTKGCIGLYWGR